jgi:hypothetical protein
VIWTNFTLIGSLLYIYSFHTVYLESFRDNVGKDDFEWVCFHVKLLTVSFSLTAVNPMCIGLSLGYMIRIMYTMNKKFYGHLITLKSYNLILYGAVIIVFFYGVVNTLRYLMLTF